jgi:hypothetical protein
MTQPRLACLLVDMDHKPSHGSRTVVDGDKDLRKQTAHSAGTNSAVRHRPPLICEYLYVPLVLR